MRLTFKGHWPTLNEYIRVERGNSMAAAAMKKKWTEKAWGDVLEQTRERIAVPVVVTFRWYRTSWRGDLDNISFAQKFIFDGIVLAKLLPNDTVKWVRRITHIPGKDKLNPRVEVEIEEAR